MTYAKQYETNCIFQDGHKRSPIPHVLLGAEIEHWGLAKNDKKY